MKTNVERYFKNVILALFFTFFTVFSSAVAQNDHEQMFEQFKDPPREFSLIPLWSWNGTLEPEELRRQIDLMIEKGVYGAFMHARAGIEKSETPYFSDGWWEAIEAAVEYSAQKGFLACLYDEDKWPSGSAGGRTLARNPKEFVKKGLRYDIERVTGPAEYEVPSSDAMKVFAVRLNSNDTFRTSSQNDMTDRKGKSWSVPRGEWAIVTFTVIEDRDKQIDYLDKNAVAAFIDITHEEYFKRFGKYFGNTIPGVFFDEIYFRPPGRNVLPWTDDLAVTFEKRKGYDLLDNLPSIVLVSEQTPRVNHDFLNEISQRYYEAWFDQYAKWCEEHNIWMTGHTEEYLDSYRKQGDYFKTIGRLHRPGTDNEEYRYGFPRYIDAFKPKQVSSAAHLAGRTRVGVEAMGGGGYMITPEEYRYGFARFGVCGLNFFMPHLFHYLRDTSEAIEDWPPSWFFRNPYWKYFKPLADYGRRISYMNSQGHHVCHVAVLNPLTDQWIAGYIEDGDTRYFTEVQQVLLNGLVDYDLMNPESLVAADCSGGKIKLYDEAYSVLVLPALNTITQQMAQKIIEFVDHGGVVVALGKIPGVFNLSNEERPADMSQLFGIDPRFTHEYYYVDMESYRPYTQKGHGNGGCAYFSNNMVNLPLIVKRNTPDEIRIVSGDPSILRFHQRRKDNATIYLLMNESKTDASWRLDFPDYGVPYLLDNETGEVTKANCLTEEGRNELVLDFKPWQAVYLVFVLGDRPQTQYIVNESTLLQTELKDDGNGLTVSGYAGSESEQKVSLLSSNDVEKTESWKNTNTLKPIDLAGQWNFMPVGKQIDDVWTDRIDEETLEIPVMKFCAVFDGPSEQFEQPGYDDSQWATVKMTDAFNSLEGGQRYLSTWNASQIVSFDRSHHFPAFGGDNAIFEKSIDIDGDIKSASLIVTVRPSFRLLVNGREVGEGSSSPEAHKFDIASFLKAGSNTISIEVPRNRGLLVEGYIETTQKRYLVLSNSSWVVHLDRGNEQAFEVLKPPMGSRNPVVFPGRSLDFPITGWYRQSLPAGAQKIVLPKSSGQLTYYLNGWEVRPDDGAINLGGLKKQTGNVLAVKCVFSQLSDGLHGPLKVICGPESVELADWSGYGLGWFSGRGIYSKEVTVNENYLRDGSKIILDMGRINWFAELWVNHKLVKYFPWGEFTADVTEYLEPGKNTITIIVSNMKANEAYWDIPDDMIENARARWWHNGATDREIERLESGLFGPVRLVPYKYIEKQVADL